MVPRQQRQLDTPGVEEGIAADEERVGSLAHKSREGRIDLAAGAGADDLDLQSHGAGRQFHVSQRRLENHCIWIEERCNTRGRRHQFMQEFQLLRRQLIIEEIDSRQVAARPGEAGDKTKPDRVFGGA